MDIQKIIDLTKDLTCKEALAFLEDGEALASYGITDQGAVEELYNEINSRYEAMVETMRSSSQTNTGR